MHGHRWTYIYICRERVIPLQTLAYAQKSTNIQHVQTQVHIDTLLIVLGHKCCINWEFFENHDMFSDNNTIF